ncbi:MAG: hypothetical protein GF390_04225 [Candidatus Pacebacteria bacterium]|nr:hypothetical protein [Candidatus Paceibacterota bacterium]
MQKRWSLKLLPKPYYLAFRLMFLFSAILSLVSLVLLPRLQPVIPLFYSLARPEQHLANKYWLLILPSLSLLISFGHLTLVKIFKNLEPRLLKIFVWLSVFYQVILTIIFIRTIWIIS